MCSPADLPEPMEAAECRGLLRNGPHYLPNALFSGRIEPFAWFPRLITQEVRGSHKQVESWRIGQVLGLSASSSAV